MNVLPADGDRHTFITTMSPDLNTVVYLIPSRHLQACWEAEGGGSSVDIHRICTREDPVLGPCMARLASAIQGPDASAMCRTEEAARGLILRLAELSGGGRPDWHDDESVFDRRTMAHLVESIDEHLRIGPSLGDMALRTGLSASHFAKKFRQTTGLSLHRFINRRRILRALEVLKDRSQPLAGVALDLGFSSQSHFTRLFSELTGMTPARYRTHFRPTVG